MSTCENCGNDLSLFEGISCPFCNFETDPAVAEQKQALFDKLENLNLDNLEGDTPESDAIRPESFKAVLSRSAGMLFPVLIIGGAGAGYGYYTATNYLPANLGDFWINSIAIGIAIVWPLAIVTFFLLLCRRLQNYSIEIQPDQFSITAISFLLNRTVSFSRDELRSIQFRTPPKVAKSFLPEQLNSENFTGALVCRENSGKKHAFGMLNLAFSEDQIRVIAGLFQVYQYPVSFGKPN